MATFFGSGLAPIAPGTAGSLAALCIAVLLERYAGVRAWHFAALAAVLLWPAIWSAGVTAERAGKKDPGFIVIDEVLGQWIAIAGARTLQWKSWLAAFVLFRLFDIWKPWPARRLEDLRGGTGIVADDLAAGAYAALVLWLAGCFNLY